MGPGSDLVIATPLQAELVDDIKKNLPGVRVRFEPELLPPVRYPGDHRGQANFRRPAEAERRWRALLSGAAVTFGIPADDPQELRWLVDNAPDLQLIQATAAGAGEQVAAARLSPEDLERVAIASSSGVHAGPLAEFALTAILAFARGLPRLRRDRAAQRWDHYPTRDVAGRTVVVLGVGAIGSRIGTLCKAFGMHVIGLNRTGDGRSGSFDQYATADQLPHLASTADVLVITLPSTSATRGMVDAAVLTALPQDAIVVNVGRGGVIDQSTLIGLLNAGRLAGAALDVTDPEPLERADPLWHLPNVILSPHTAALSPQENQRIVSLFLDNVARLQRGESILNRVTAAHPY